MYAVNNSSSLKKIVLILLITIIISLIVLALVTKERTENYFQYLFPSEGVIINNDNGDIIFHTEEEENGFNSVRLQLNSDIPKKYIMDITSSKEGENKGLYHHLLDSGVYVVTLKANSNKKDEVVDLRVMLLKGKYYVYSYNIMDLTDKTIVVQEYLFDRFL